MKDIVKKSLTFAPLIGAAALAAGWAIRSSLRTHYTFAGKSVFITGGSRGLGLVLARQFAQQGARLTLVSRSAASLETAQQDVQALGAEVFTIPADIRDPRQAASAVARAIDRYGAIDVLINNAGIIQVGPYEVMTVDEFKDAMDTHFWGPLSLIMAVVPHMKSRGTGRIVNISSIGGRVAVPHLMPYTASKFALAGLSDAFRAELAPSGIAVTSVYPGLMRTGSHVNAYFKGKHEQEFAWFSAMSGLPMFSIDAGRAARQIVEACRERRPDLVITTQARIAVAVQGMFPSLMATAMKLIHRILPGPDSVAANELRAGWDSTSRWSPSILTRLADKATEDNNEYQAA